VHGDARPEPAATEPDGSQALGMLELITAAGKALNRCSYPVPRITKVINEICDAYGYEITTEVFATYVIAVDRNAGQVEVANTGDTYRFDQIADTEDLIHRLRNAELAPEDGVRGLQAIADSAPPNRPLVRIIGYVLMALGFALCFRMSWAASLTAVLIAVPAAAVLLWSNLQGTLAALMPFLLTFVSALGITLWAVHGDIGDPVRLAVIPVLALIPGAALTTAIIEITTADMIAGSTRLIYALMVLMSMAFGLALAIDLVGLSNNDLQDLTPTQAPVWVLWFAAPVFALGNSLYTCTPLRFWGWVVTFAFGTYSLSLGLQKVMLPAFAGGIAIGVALLAAWVVNAYAKGHPSVLVMFLPTFWLLVPGSMGFVAVSGAITEDRQLDSLGNNAALSLMSIAMCMMIASVLAPYVARRRKARAD